MQVAHRFSVAHEEFWTRKTQQQAILRRSREELTLFRQKPWSLISKFWKSVSEQSRKCLICLISRRGFRVVWTIVRGFSTAAARSRVHQLIIPSHQPWTKKGPKICFAGSRPSQHSERCGRRRTGCHHGSRRAYMVNCTVVPVSMIPASTGRCAAFTTALRTWAWANAGQYNAMGVAWLRYDKTNFTCSRSVMKSFVLQNSGD